MRGSRPRHGTPKEAFPLVRGATRVNTLHVPECVGRATAELTEFFGWDL